MFYEIKITAVSFHNTTKSKLMLNELKTQSLSLGYTQCIYYPILYVRF